MVLSSDELHKLQPSPEDIKAYKRWQELSAFSSYTYRDSDREHDVSTLIRFASKVIDILQK